MNIVNEGEAAAAPPSGVTPAPAAADDDEGEGEVRIRKCAVCFSASVVRLDRYRKASLRHTMTIERAPISCGGTGKAKDMIDRHGIAKHSIKYEVKHDKNYKQTIKHGLQTWR
jgi:hypothetical protein